VSNGAREQLQESLTAGGISTGVHYPIALPYLNAYRHLGHVDGDFPEALRASREIVSLPLFPELTLEQLTYVTETITSAPCLRTSHEVLTAR
jgi:dTDP-4-amino-4,6-dideoxygalactose transaminase